MWIVTLVLFLFFFGLVVPAFLYWFSHFSKGLLDKKLPFIGFPEDGRTAGAPPSEGLDADDEERPRRS